MTRQRDNNAELISKLGFSVVAPTRIMVPVSMCAENCPVAFVETVDFVRRRGCFLAVAACAAGSHELADLLTPERTAKMDERASTWSPASGDGRFNRAGGPQMMNEGFPGPALAQHAARTDACSWPTPLHLCGAYVGQGALGETFRRRE
jgi:hypothetical protein